MPDHTLLILRSLLTLIRGHIDPNDAGNNHEMRMLADEMRIAIEVRAEMEAAVAKPAATETRSQRK